MSGAHSQSSHVGYGETNTLARLPRLLTRAVHALAFWLAVVFPLAYVPILGGGISRGELLPLLALLAGNVLALTVGHDHAR